MKDALRLFAAIFCAVGAGACGGSSTAPTPATEFFLGTLNAQGDGFYSFTLASDGSVDVTLVSMTSANPGPAVTAQVSIGVGTPQGEGCSVAASVNTAPGFSSQLTSQMDKGIHCVDIHDTGNLSQTVTFAVRIVHP